MKKNIKIFSMLILVSVMLVSCQNFVVAAKNAISFNEAIGDDKIKIDATTPTDTGIIAKVGSLVGLLQWIAMIGGILIIAVLGVKYMMGSTEEKANYKKTIVPLIIGIVVVMSATAIANLIFGIGG